MSQSEFKLLDNTDLPLRVRTLMILENVIYPQKVLVPFHGGGEEELCLFRDHSALLVEFVYL